MALSLATAFVFGLLPAIRASRINLQASLHGDATQDGARADVVRAPAAGRAPMSPWRSCCSSAPA